MFPFTMRAFQVVPVVLSVDDIVRCNALRCHSSCVTPGVPWTLRGGLSSWLMFAIIPLPKYPFEMAILLCPNCYLYLCDTTCSA